MGRGVRAFAISMLCGLLGVLLAIMIQLFNSAGIIVDEFITASLTLREVQAIIIIIWLMIGVGISAIEN